MNHIHSLRADNSMAMISGAGLEIGLLEGGVLEESRVGAEAVHFFRSTFRGGDLRQWKPAPLLQYPVHRWSWFNSRKYPNEEP